MKSSLLKKPALDALFCCLLQIVETSDDVCNQKKIMEHSQSSRTNYFTKVPIFSKEDVAIKEFIETV